MQYSASVQHIKLKIHLKTVLESNVCTEPCTRLLWSSPGVQLRVTARRLGSVIWRRTGGSGRSEGDTFHYIHIEEHCICLNNIVFNVQALCILSVVSDQTGHI